MGRAAGKKSQTVGAAWEQEILNECALYRAAGRADVFKVPTPVEPAKGPRRLWAQIKRLGGQYLLARKESRTWVDFAGTLAGGRAVHFEAKSVSHDTRFPFSTLSEHQQLVLHRQAVLGALTFVYVQRRCGIRRKRYLFPVTPGDGERVCTIAGVTTRKSVNWDDQAPAFELKLNEGWFEAAQRLGLMEAM